MNRFLKFTFAVLLLCFSLLNDNILTLGEVNLFVLTGILVLDYFDNKSISLLQVWILGFIYIILSEIVLIEPGKNVLEAVKFLLTANILIIFGYLMPINFGRFRKTKALITRSRSPKRAIYILIGLVIAYLVYAIPGAILKYNMGRNTAAAILSEDRNLVLGSLSRGLSLVLPSIIMFYYKEFSKNHSIFFPLILSLPIFIILFIGGSRFPLLFSMGGFIIMSQAKGSGKISLNAKLILLLGVMVAASFLMGQFRSSGFAEFKSYSTESTTEIRLSRKIATEMSPEGVVDMTALMFTHFEAHPHTYGSSIAFLTYFWIPREIWPDKPTMLGHWLIREYRSGFGSGHSSSFGFTGELFADFGYFSLLFVFLLGITLKWANNLNTFYLSQPRSYNKILVGMIFSYVFFFVRSPITATMTFLVILVVQYLIRKLLFINSVKEKTKIIIKYQTK